MLPWMQNLGINYNKLCTRQLRKRSFRAYCLKHYQSIVILKRFAENQNHLLEAYVILTNK